MPFPKYPLGLLLILTVPVQANDIDPKILDYFPACHYQILDTVIYKQRLGNKFQDAGEEHLQQATQSIVAKIKARAREIGADSIAIIDKSFSDQSAESVLSGEPTSGYVGLTAELFNHCEEHPDAPRKMTPYDASGTRRAELEARKAKMDINILIDLDAGYREVHRPALPPLSLTASSGMFGLRTGASYDQVVSSLGTPTAEFIANGGSKVIAYGRRLWLVFDDQTLQYATNQNHWLSYDIVNMFEFDDRISAQPWSIDGKFETGMALGNEQLAELGERIAPDRVLLEVADNGAAVFLLLENYHDNKLDQDNFRVMGYAYGARDSRYWEVDTGSHIAQADTYQELVSLVKQKRADFDPIFKQDIAAKPVLMAINQDQEQIMALDNHLVLEFKRRHLRNIHMLESVFSHESASQGWQFDGIHQGQTKPTLREYLGDRVFESGDTWQVEYPGFTQEVYFYHSDGESRALASLISVY